MNSFPLTQYDDQIWHAKGNIHLARRAILELKTWTWVFVSGALALMAMGFLVQPFLLVFVSPCLYGAMKVKLGINEAKQDLQRWEDEYFLWASARGLETGESVIQLF